MITRYRTYLIAVRQRTYGHDFSYTDGYLLVSCSDLRGDPGLGEEFAGSSSAAP
jgi:hypothetical protein